MGKRLDLNAFEGEMIVGALSYRVSINEIPAFFKKIQEQPIVNMLKDYTVRRKSVWACELWLSATSQSSNRVRRLVQDNTRVTVYQFTADLNQKSQMVSKPTVYYTLYFMWYGSQSPVRTPFLSAVNKRKISNLHRNIG